MVSISWPREVFIIYTPFFLWRKLHICFRSSQMQHIILITARIKYTGLPKQSDNVFRFPTINHIPICIRHKRNNMIPIQRTKSSVFRHRTDSVFRKPASTGTMLQQRYVIVNSFNTFSDTCIISRYVWIIT